MNGKRDSQRKRVYNSETVIHGKNFVSIPEIQEYVDKISHSSWWKKNHRYYTYNIEVKDGRGCRNAYAVGFRTIKLPKWSRHESVILHELSHTIINSHFMYGAVAAHGCEFSKIYLLMVKRFMGKDEYKKLKMSFKDWKVKYSTSKI